MPRKDYDLKASYAKHPGWVAWVFHRASDLLLVLYFILHMLGSGGVFDSASMIVRNPYVEAIIVIMFAWHAMNGLRIVFMEFFSAAERYSFKKWFLVFSALAIFTSLIGLSYLKGSLMPTDTVVETETVIIEEAK